MTNTQDKLIETVTREIRGIAPGRVTEILRDEYEIKIKRKDNTTRSTEDE